jgi:hypothetical protein
MLLQASVKPHPTPPSPCRHGYFQSLPRREYLPIFWSAEELALLQGSEVEGRPQEDL